MIIPWFRIGATVAVLVALIAAFQSQRQIGAAKAVATINQQTQVINAKARKARAAARAPGAIERVRKDYCRDC